MRNRSSGEFTPASTSGFADSGSGSPSGESSTDFSQTSSVSVPTQRRSRGARRLEDMETGIESMFTQFEHTRDEHGVTFSYDHNDRPIRRPSAEHVSYFDDKVTNYHRVINGTVGELGGQAVHTMLQDADHDVVLTQLIMAKDTFDNSSALRDRIQGRRRKAKHGLANASERYQEAHRDNFTSTLGQLTIARAQVAEQSHTGRKGRLVSKFSRNRNKLEDSFESYKELRSLHFEESFNQMVGQEADRPAPYAAKAQFRTSFDAHEDGTLAGEEMHHLIAAETDPRSKSFIERTVDGYNNLSKKQKAMVMGAAALSGFAVGAVAGGAIAGLSFAGRFAKNYFTTAANRQAVQAEQAIDFSQMTDEEAAITRNQLHRDRWQDASLYTGNYQQLATEQPDLRKKHEDEEYFRTSAAYVDTMFQQAEQTMFAERMDERHEKQTVLAKAMGKTALTAGGGALLGAVVDVVSDYIPVDDWVESATKWTKDNIKLREWFTGRIIPGNAIPDLSALRPTLPPVELPELPQLPPINPEGYHLYGDYAGQRMGITIPEGSSIWGQLEQQIGQEYPALPDDERERLTANIWAQLSIQNPDLDFSRIAAGTRLEVAL